MKPFPILLLALVSLVAAMDTQDSETTAVNPGWEENVTTTTSESSVSIDESTTLQTIPAEDSKNISAAPSSRSLLPEEDRTTTVASTIEAITTEGSSTSSTSSRGRSLNTRQRSSVVKLDKEEDIKHHKDENFEYDYNSLRKWGLIAAAILFILGILVLTCGKHGKLLRCRRKKRARHYDVTPA
ncbi:PREDICTED: FXYD domain-containing ion transport regulator 5-like [Gekko japonicus]|uniref:FXYD domain-containing ion transport regulator n=1 Tax=Gekko japonicus TaxID=146911 RepID=A0ABM1JWA3_GEKJA|nr:PREDICTED: FXYD domain-containing ion transport regulator 5-like [Gekko japonicus]